MVACLGSGGRDGPEPYGEAADFKLRYEPRRRPSSAAAPAETLEAARDAIGTAFGVLPALMYRQSAAGTVREAQRHLAQWMMQPLAAVLAEEAMAKLGGRVEIDVMRPLQAFDTGGRARALTSIVDALAARKEAGVEGEDIAKALALVGWPQE